MGLDMGELTDAAAACGELRRASAAGWCSMAAMRRGRIWQTPRSWAWSTWCSTKKCGLEQTDMTPSAWIYGQLKRFRAGLEAGISYSEAVLRSDRCNWRGWEHFQAYVPPWLSMLRYPFKTRAAGNSGGPSLSGDNRLETT